MIVAFDFQEPNTLWEFYNNPSNTKKTGTINAIAKKIVEFESSGWISSLKYSSSDNPPESLICLLWADLDLHANTIADDKQLDDISYKRKERRMLRQLYKSSVKSGFSSDDSEKPSSRDYDFNETLLNFLVEKLRADSNPSTNEDEVRENIADLILEEDFPDDLIPKSRSHKQGPCFMEQQGIIPPWVRQVAPTVLNLLTNADDCCGQR